jgi:hypothetical protein
MLTAAAVGLLVIGVAAVAGWMPPLANYTYPILWCGILPLADAWNCKRRGLSLWRGRERHFLFITVPVSVLFWLLYEALNLPAPQWRYRGGLESLHAQVAFGFIAFATVIPIVMEAWWIAGGESCLLAGWQAALARHRWLCVAVSLAFVSTPFYNDIFWFNQGIWLAPGILLAAFVPVAACATPAGFWRGAVVGGLLAGFAWEASNYWALTRWEYLILPDVPHLFAMPAPGYVGFIPFAVTTMIVYQWQLQWKLSASRAIFLYAAAIAMLYWVTDLYTRRGLWLVFRSQ